MLVLVMMREIHRHMDAEEFEGYSMGRLSEEDTARIEEHLLICDSCRTQLEESEEYIAAMSRAARVSRRPKPKARWNWDVMQVIRMVAVAACLIVVASLAVRWFGSAQPLVAVSLSTTRASGGEAIAPAGRSLQIRPDLTGITPSSSYRLEIVDANGGSVWRGGLDPSSSTATVPGRAAGTYFVRVYSADGALLREYGLRVQ